MLKRMMLVALVLLSLSYICTVHSDMGRVTTSDAVVSEDSQKAIIFHNNEEEILILGTDLKADKKTTILRFIPFPSEPTVKLAEGKPFDRVSELMKEHGVVFVSIDKSGNSSTTPVEVTFSAKIGAHDITVICINNITEFKDWVAEFLKSKGMTQGKNNDEVERVALDYVKRDIKYFVFDFVEISPEPQLVEPIAYGFKSRELYYPLKTSNTFGGFGGIDLIIIAPGTLCSMFSGALYVEKTEDIYQTYPCFEALSHKNPSSYPVRVSTSAKISKTEAASIYTPGKDFFSDKESIFLQLIRYNGKYDFDEDILIDISIAPKEGFESDDVYFGLPGIFSINLPDIVIPPADGSGSDDPDRSLKQACLKATMAAIQLEMFCLEDRYAAAIEGAGNKENALVIDKRISELDDENYKYKNMWPGDYELPDKITVKVKTTQLYQQGSILELKKMSRSGPFYHIIGVFGEEDSIEGIDYYESFKPNKSYRMEIYPVFQHDYPFPSYYVYIGDFK